MSSFHYTPTGPKYLNIVAAEGLTTVVKTGSGTLLSVVVNLPDSSATITLYDNTAASGATIAGIANALGGPYALAYGCVFSTGLTVVTTGVVDLTVVYM